MIETFGLLFFVGHLGHTTEPESVGILPSASTGSPWHKEGVSMYKRDKYARDRVMKSARLLLPFIKDTDTILDVGCFTWEARKYFPRSVNYIGIDQKQYHAKTKVLDLNHGFEPIPCQAALCLETLEHLLDPEDTLISISNSLSNDSRLVVSLPNEATAFHRIRCLLGVVDGGAFQGEGKHIHLPNLKQSLALLKNHFHIEKILYYISPSACESQSAWLGKILSLIPDSIHQLLADKFPSLFARGFIFLCKKKSTGQETHEKILPTEHRPLPERPPQLNVTG